MEDNEQNQEKHNFNTYPPLVPTYIDKFPWVVLFSLVFVTLGGATAAT